MSEIDRFKPDDRRGVDTLYRRTHGADAANALRLRWDWQHRRNPYNQSGQPEIWVAREGPTVVGHYTTLPVRVSIKGIEVEGAWGSDAMGGISLLSSMSGPGGGIAHTTHLGGLVAGYLYLKGGRIHLLSEFKYRYLKWRINRMRRKFDVYSGGRADDVNRRVH